MQTHDGRVVEPYTSREHRDIITQQYGVVLEQSAFSRALTHGWFISSARFDHLPAFTAADLEHNLRWLGLNYNEAGGMISKRRRKKPVRGKYGEYRDALLLDDSEPDTGKPGQK